MTDTAKSFARLVLCSLLAAGVPTLAHAAMIADTTQNVSYYGNSPTNWFNGGTTSVGDVVEGGPEFDTNRVNVTTGPLTLQLDFYTQFDGDDLGAHYADIFSWRQEPTRTSSPTASPLARSSAMAASRRAFTRSATTI